MPIPPTMDELLEDLLARIERKEFPPGSQLPSGQKLADQYGVSPATIQRATARLRQRGILIGRPGRGVFVAEKPGR
ncbi:winged helix-turn-helix domain-containing protein [Plantactinospora sp. ZYX-F-223]|uniref:winged helix-turn-helix domain-containing protein n=1 Tax=Plantactinospora sp. ZYX-F-223 TaxID=3144103 RepID=UPI0031FD685B